MIPCKLQIYSALKWSEMIYEHTCRQEKNSQRSQLREYNVAVGCVYMETSCCSYHHYIRIKI